MVLTMPPARVKTYAIDQLPEWVDHVQPEDFIMTQLNNKGEYVHGYLNFGDKDKIPTSPARRSFTTTEAVICSLV